MTRNPSDKKKNAAPASPTDDKALRIRNRIICTAVAFVSLAADQYSKALAKGLLVSHPEGVSLIPGFLGFVKSYNNGVAFGMLSGAPLVFIHVPVILMVVAMIVFYERLTKGGAFGAVGLGMLLGGAVGNLVDRVRVGSVFDFIDAYAGKYHWHTFNVADAFIVVGVLMFSFTLLAGEKES